MSVLLQSLGISALIFSLPSFNYNIIIQLFFAVPKFGMRHIQMILLSFMMAIAVGMRMILSISIVAMNDPTACPKIGRAHV